MIEININKAKRNFGFKKVLDGFDFEANTGDRIGLIGPNGCGKTTLFKIIAGEEKLDSGTISVRKGASAGLLSQIPPKVSDDLLVKDVLLKNFEKVFNIEKKMREDEKNFANLSSKELDKALKSYGRLQDEFQALGGYEIGEKISRVCGGFKISDDMLNRSFNFLSGGEKTIVSLASLVLRNPDILLLDEPTNHLDIETLEWFEKFLGNYKGTIVISSHDRYFLDKVVTKIVFIDKGKADIYNGNYSYYLKESERRTLAEFESYKNQQKQIEAMRAAIKRLRQWGTEGDNPIFFRRAANIERRIERMEMIDKPDSKKKIPLSFEIDDRSGKDVLKIDKIDLSAGKRELLKGASMSLKYGEKVCLMGKNGSGKSTLVKEILNLSDDKIKIGAQVSIGYIPQEIRFENDEATILEVSRKVFDGDEMLHKMQHGFNIVGILAELLHQRANLAVHTGVRLRCFHAGRAGRHDKLGIKKALRQGDDQHGRKADPQKDQQQARGQRGDGSGRGISHGSAAPVVQDAPQGGAAPRP